MTLTHTPNTAQGQKVRRRSQHTPAVMWSKLRVETEIAERGSTAEQPLSRLHVSVKQCILGYLTFTLFNILVPNLWVLTPIQGHQSSVGGHEASLILRGVREAEVPIDQCFIHVCKHNYMKWIVLRFILLFTIQTSENSYRIRAR